MSKRIVLEKKQPGKGLMMEGILPHIPVARVTVVESVYHQPAHGEAREFGNRYERNLTTNEEPWSRKFLVGAEWQALDCGWLDRASELQLVNRAGVFPQTQPTDDERLAEAAKVIELGIGIGDGVHRIALIPPQCSARFQPPDARALHVRCQAGTAECRVVLLPV